MCVSLLGGVDPRTSENLQRLSRECFVVSCVSFDKRKRERQREREREREREIDRWRQREERGGMGMGIGVRC